jgi:hypothetical protein
MRSFQFIAASRAIIVPLTSASLMLAAHAATPLTPNEAANRYAAVLARMVASAESVHDEASARTAMRVFVDGTRERLAQRAAVEAMSPAAQTVYEQLIQRRRRGLDAMLARFDAALARMMANQAYVQALADTGRARSM